MHAILVHDGVAESGHYYAFVYDRKSQYWYRFNDHSVSVEDEKVVMKEAFGGSGYACAYGLIYINQDIASEIEQTELSEYSLPFRRMIS